MRLLASALPGFRDLRAPLTAGYLWLILFWIGLKPNLATRPTNEIAGSIYDLAKAAGPIWVGLAVGIAAYLTGSISQVLSPPLGAFVKLLWNISEQILNQLRKRLKWIPLLPVSNPRSPLGRYWDQALEELVQINLQNNENDKTEDEVREIAEAYLDYLAGEARPEIERDVSLPATLLLAKESLLLFTEADRLNAERQFRLAVAPPLIAITVLVSCSASTWWLFMLVPILVLLWQSHIRQLEYRYLMYGALERRIIESDSVEEFRRMAGPELADPQR